MTIFDKPLDTFESFVQSENTSNLDNQTISIEYNYAGFNGDNGTQVAFTTMQMNEVVAWAR